MIGDGMDVTEREEPRDAHAADPPAEPGFDDRVPALDGVRGFALIFTLLFHFSFMAGVPRDALLDRVVKQITDATWFGMDLFFVLSGFLITGILYDAKVAGGANYFRNFYARRGLRIFPAHYALLIFMFLVFPLVQPMEKAAIAAIRHDWEWNVTYLANVRIALDHGRRADIFVMGHVWSLSVEEQFYIVWPFVVFLLNRQKLIVACCIAIFAAMLMRVGMTTAGVNTWYPYLLSPARMDSLAIGSLIAIAARDPRDIQLVKRYLPPAALAAAAFIAVLSVAHGEFDIFAPWSRMFGHTSLAIVWGMLVFTAATGSRHLWVNRALEHRILTTLGTYSYAMYLVHLPIAYVLYHRTDVSGVVPPTFGSYLGAELFFMFVAFVPTFIIGALSWHLYEKQVLKLKRFFPYAKRARSDKRIRQSAKIAGALGTD